MTKEQHDTPELEQQGCLSLMTSFSYGGRVDNSVYESDWTGKGRHLGDEIVRLAAPTLT